jgi:hypothetical protein
VGDQGGGIDQNAGLGITGRAKVRMRRQTSQVVSRNQNGHEYEAEAEEILAGPSACLVSYSEASPSFLTVFFPML